MGLLLVNLCLCSWEKSYIALTLYKKRNFKKNARFYEAAGHAVAVPWRGDKDDLEKKLKSTYTVNANSDNAYYSQKGLLGRTGATIIHIGLLWTMVAGFYRILADDFNLGVYDATVILPEGQIANHYVTRKDRLKEPSGDNLIQKPMPFVLRALDFHAEYFPHSTVAKDFASTVELTDGDFRRIYQVTMTNPLLYRGYKITQNSFSANERIRRGKFRVTEVESGLFAEIDAMPGDPVVLRGLANEKYYFQVDELDTDTRFHVLDLDDQGIIQTGHAVKPEELPLPIDMRPFAEELSDSRYSMMVAAFFPNFILDENMQPTTKDEKFENPAVMLTLFKNGRPNGYTWLFLNPEAQEIVGQPHPEVSLTFENYRRKNDSGEAREDIYNYEVQIRVVEKRGQRDLGGLWLSAGQFQELDVTDALLKTANIRMDRLTDTHAQIESTSATLAADGTSDTLSIASADESAGEEPTAAEEEAGPFQVEYMGMTSGHVTFLGFMQDPSVGWLFAGCLIIIAGTLVAFILVYRETWTWYDEERGLLYMATAVRGTSPAAHREFDRLVAEIKALPQTPMESAPVAEPVA